MSLFLKAVIALVCVGASCALAQEADPRPADAAQPSVSQLSQQLQQTRAELAESKREIEELRQSVEELRKQMQVDHPPEAAAATPSEPTVAAADQDVGFLAAKVGEMHQDKVESASKYPVKLSGLVLFNSYWNNGILDIQDLPNLALPNFPGAPRPGIGATLRQTMFGIDATGPKIFGARTSAGVEIDFGGGSPTTDFGVATGLVRLRTAKINLDWPHTTLTIGQDSPFFSPLSPTSYATLLEPAFSWSGNLWVWTPGIELTQRFALNDSSALVLQGGFLDPLTEETPEFEGRVPTAGEVSRAPAMAGRIAFDRSKASRYPFTIGFAGYRAQQQYQTFPTVASWTLNTDIKAGFGSHFEISGEWYTGQAVGGLGGGIWSSVIFPEATEPHTAIHPLRSTGGWAQLKVIPAARFEINSAFGQDENFGQNLRFFPASFTSGGFDVMQKNRTELLNLIYRPTSILLLAMEYRHLFTLPANAPAHSGDQINLAAGVHF